MKPVSPEMLKMLLVLAGPYSAHNHVMDFRHRISRCEDCMNYTLCDFHLEELRSDPTLSHYAKVQASYARR